MHLDVRVAEALEAPGRGLCELAHDLDAVDLGHELGEHGGLVAAPGPHLEDNVARARLEHVGHHRDDIGLRDGLAAADGKRGIVVGVARVLLRHERLARHLGEGRRHPRVERLLAEIVARLLHLLRDLRHEAFAKLVERGGRSAAAAQGVEDHRGEFSKDGGGAEASEGAECLSFGGGL